MEATQLGTTCAQAKCPPLDPKLLIRFDLSRRNVDACSREFGHECVTLATPGPDLERLAKTPHALERNLGEQSVLRGVWFRQVEGIPLLTADPAITRYDVETIW